MSRARSMTYPGDNEVVQMNYNSQGLPATLCQIQGTTCPSSSYYVSNSAYNQASQLTSLTLGNGATTTYNYYPNNLHLQRLQTIANGATLQDINYNTYDNVGNVQQIVDNVRGETSQFTYDDLNRLSTAGINGVYSQAWNYNQIGNILTRTETINNSTTTLGYEYKYDPNDPTKKPHAATKMGNNTYSYDSNGNMLSHAGDSLTFDNENRLIQVQSSGNITKTIYTYNGDGARVKKEIQISGVTQEVTYYVGNYYEVKNGAATKYYYFGAQRVAMNQGSTLYYLHADHLGSSSVTSDAGGNQVGTQNYFAFGTPRASTGNLQTDFTFTGQKFDQSDSLMYYGARYYDAQLGRFISADTMVPFTVEPQFLNRYSYTLNNPVRYTDPTGHCPCLIALPIAEIALFAGAAIFATYESYELTLAPNAAQNRENLNYAIQSGLDTAKAAADSVTEAVVKLRDVPAGTEGDDRVAKLRQAQNNASNSETGFPNMNNLSPNDKKKVTIGGILLVIGAIIEQIVESTIDVPKQPPATDPCQGAKACIGPDPRTAANPNKPHSDDLLPPYQDPYRPGPY